MKKARDAGSKSAAQAARNVPADPNAAYTVRMKPRGKLFVALLVAFALWFALLTWLYFTTVKPGRPAGPVTGVALKGI